MNKRIRIVLEELVACDSAGGREWEHINNVDGYTTRLYDYEYPNLYLKETVSESDVIHAFEIIATYFKQTGKNWLMADLGLMNQGREVKNDSREN